MGVRIRRIYGLPYENRELILTGHWLREQLQKGFRHQEMIAVVDATLRLEAFLRPFVFHTVSHSPEFRDLTICAWRT